MKSTSSHCSILIYALKENQYPKAIYNLVPSYYIKSQALLAEPVAPGRLGERF
jgi:hypothetical protein